MKVGIATICVVLQNILAVNYAFIQIHGNDISPALIDQFAALALLIIPNADNP
jgi:hypothetical protein